MFTERMKRGLSLAARRAIGAALVSAYFLFLAVCFVGDSKFLWLPIIGIPISVVVVAIHGFLTGFLIGRDLKQKESQR